MLPLPIDYVQSPAIVVNDNAAWCWFQNERAIIHDGVVLVGSVACGNGAGGKDRDGNIELAAWKLADNSVQRTVLHKNLESDDHDAPALLVRKDGRLLAVYSKHAREPVTYWRISKRPGDISEFGETKSLQTPPHEKYINLTYQNVYRLPAEGGRLYNFVRSLDKNPHYFTSDDDGDTWRYGGKFLNWPMPTGDPKFTGFDGGRPYTRYVSNDRDTIHVFTTEDHPRGYDNSVYHGFLRGGKIHRSDGAVVGELSKTKDTSIKVPDLTCIYQGNPDNVAWTSDIRLDAGGLPVVTFSVQKNDGDKRHISDAPAGADLRYHYARFDGKQWTQREIAHAGHRLFAKEQDYTGLITIHPYNPDVVYISTSSHPTTGEHLVSKADGQRHYEIFKGVTKDQGGTWAWTPITANSSKDNLRPIVPPGDPKTTVLLWYRGTYRHYIDFTTEAVGMIDEK